MAKKDFMSLTIKDSFMFYAVMSDPEQCRRLLTLVLDTQISTIKRNREWRSRYMLMELLMAEEREEGISRGELRKVIDQCCRKLSKGKSAEEIADALECDISQINAIVEVAQKYAPDYDIDGILEELCRENPL